MGGGGGEVLWHLILIFRSPSSSSHYIVGLITGGLELVWISGVIVMVEETTQSVSLGETYAKVASVASENLESSSD